MEYVYHMVPNKMVDNKLVSLNSLKEKNVELYKEYRKKYSDHPD